MIQLIGGPAAGAYAVKRAPILLRAVTGPKGNDVLDQIGDEPADDEDIHVYLLQPGTEGTVHLNTGRKKGSGFYATGIYHYLAEIDGAPFRSQEAWRTWATDYALKIKREIQERIESHG